MSSTEIVRHFRAALDAVIRTGESILHEHIPGERLAQRARTAEHLRLLRALELRSVVVVPMRVPNRTVGAMLLATAESGRRLTEEDRELAEQLGRREGQLDDPGEDFLRCELATPHLSVGGQIGETRPSRPQRLVDGRARQLRDPGRLPLDRARRPRPSSWTRAPISPAKPIRRA